MKLLIDNRTFLSNEEIGIILDDLMEREKGSTQYYGKWKGYELAYKNRKIHIETMLMKKYYKVLIIDKTKEKNYGTNNPKRIK